MPDVRTLINVRQSLLSTGRNAATSKGNIAYVASLTQGQSELSSSPHSTDPDAADNFGLIPDLIYLLTLYQKLSPVLLYQADFNMASLVYELNDVLAASPVISHTLSLLLDAPPESLKKLMKVRPLHELLCIHYAYIIRYIPPTWAEGYGIIVYLPSPLKFFRGYALLQTYPDNFSSCDFLY